jgi:hypothetical protein
MKNIFKIVLFALITISGLNSCYKEANPNDGNFDIIGDVAIVSELTSPVAAAAAGSVLNLTIKLSFVNTTVKELKFYDRYGTSGTFNFVRSIPFVPNFDQAQRVHVITVPYTLPATKGRYSIQVEAVSDNNLVSARRSMTPSVFNIN